MQEFICFCLFPVWLFYFQSCSLLKEFSFFRQPECFFFEVFFHLCVWGRMAKKIYLIVLSFHCHGTGELYNAKEWVFSWKTSRKKRSGDGLEYIILVLGENLNHYVVMCSCLFFKSINISTLTTLKYNFFPPKKH